MLLSFVVMRGMVGDRFRLWRRVCAVQGATLKCFVDPWLSGVLHDAYVPSHMSAPAIDSDILQFGLAYCTLIKRHRSVHVPTPTALGSFA
eukprot:m.67157 g.67157  ORF g.67157 m.67157 type:complete len:90 (+) comp12158_c0_seq2:192-461(+)